MADKRVLKIILAACVGGLVLAVVIATQAPSGGQESRAVPRRAAGGGDWLDDELERCRTLGPADRPDDRCEAAWAENRRRFFGDHAKGR